MHLLRFDAEDAWVDGVGMFWRDRLNTNPRLSVCLPTGLTPVPIYAAMVRSVRTGLASFAAATVFALDEFGGLAPDDPGRTRNTLLRQLIANVDLPPTAFHTMDPDATDLEQVCQRYEAIIGRGFDLVLLGVGLNGHLGMNEPGTAADSPTRRVELHESTIQSSARYFQHRNLPRWGLTVGLGSILSSKEIWVLAKGSAKAAIVREAVKGPMTTDVPVSLLRQHANCAMFVDGDAGALL